MQYLSENLKKYRLRKNLTQEELADFLHVTPQSVSKWERGESCPDITFLPALANIFDTSVDLLLGMDEIRAEKAVYTIHSSATDRQRQGDLEGAEKIYRDALKTYPNSPDMMLGLAGTLALKGDTKEAVHYVEKGLPLSENEKQKATLRAVLCYLCLREGDRDRAVALASCLPHARESREEILPMMQKQLTSDEISFQIRRLILGE